MATKKFKTKSDYSILRRKHQSTTQGVVYENDFMTLNKMDELFAPDQTPVYSDSNFKFSVRNTLNMQKKHARNAWSDSITLNTIGENNLPTEETTIRIKPDYNSITDFAYYGSAMDLVKATLNGIVSDFPGELYFSTEEHESIKSIPWPIEWGNKPEHFYVVSNGFNINIWDKYVDENKVSNPLRYFALSAKHYNVINDTTIETPTIIDESLWEVVFNKNVCVKDDSGSWYAKVKLAETSGIDSGVTYINCYVLAYKGKYYTYYSDATKAKRHIRPSEAKIKAYYEALDDFTRVLLDRDSIPRYTAYFDTPMENDEGFYSIRKAYTFPKVGGYNPDIESTAYGIYIDSLVKLTAFFDDFNCNVINRAMTHEAIKNLDWTYIDKDNDATEEYSNIDSTRIDAILKVWGRQYDDIKRYIDSMKHSNNISYNEKNDMPDYCLSDALENDGWDAISLDLCSENTIRTPKLYPGEVEGYTSAETNLSFLRRLKMNSSYLLNSKGTRHGIEAMLKLFGFEDYEFDLTEKICVAKPKTSAGYPKYEDVAKYNAMKDNFLSENYDPLMGLPMKAVYVVDEDDNESNYMIPWFDNTAKYDGDLYYQMYGGWGKRNNKRINLDIAKKINLLEERPSANLFIYDETQSNLRFVSDLTELRNIADDNTVDGTVVYVTDLSNIMDEYSFKNQTERDNFMMYSGYSHYFILEHKEVSTIVGWYSGTRYGARYGWRNILVNEYNTPNIKRNKPTDAGWKVLYLESMIEETNGNNPHVGNLKYDKGGEYIRRMSSPFIWSKENDNFSKLSDADITKACNIGYNATEIEDNVKCWYFENALIEDKIYDITNASDIKLNPQPNFINYNYLFYRDLHNPEVSGTTDDEAAANSIINVKYFDLSLTPHIPDFIENEELYKKEMGFFIQNKVLPYVKAMIPSTAILSYTITYI